MIIQIDKKELEQGLSKVSKTLPKASPIQVLNMIKLCATESSVVLTTDNGKNSTEYEIPVSADNQSVSVEQTGSVLIPKVFVDMVKKLGRGVRIEVRDNPHTESGKNVQIRSTDPKIKSEIDLQGLSTEEFPLSVNTTGKPTLTLKAAELASMISRTVFTASDSESTPILTGVHVNIVDGMLKFNATDRHRLARVAKNVDTKEELGHGFVIAAKAFEDFAKMIPDADTVELYFVENKFVGKAGHVKFCSTMIDGTFPDTSKLTPPKEKYVWSFLVNRKELISAMERVFLLKPDKGPSITTLTISPDSGSITLEDKQSQLGKVREEIFVRELTGNELKVALNTEYVIKALEANETSNVFFGFTGQLAPVIIHPEENYTDLQLILPFRVSN